MGRQLVSWLVVLWVLSGCGGSSTPEPTATPVPAVEQAAPTAQAVIAATLEVAMHDIYFGDNNNNLAEPPVWRVPSGGEVTVNLENLGGLDHNWAIVQKDAELPVPFMPDQNSDLVLWAAGVLLAGEKATDTFTAPVEPGEYIVICTVACHYPAMQGRLLVESM
jgi:plastocyanin